MPDSLLPPPSGQDYGRTAMPGAAPRRAAGLPVRVAAVVLATLLPFTAAFLAWQLRSSEHELAALQLSARLEVTAAVLEQQARSALRESPGGGPMPGWYAEELRRKAPACSQLIDALAARELPPALTGQRRSLRFDASEATRRRIEASAASWQAVRNQIEPALRPGSSDADVRAAAVTLEALGPLVIESSADLARTLRDAMQDRWRLHVAAQWSLAAATALASVVLVLMAWPRRRPAD